MPELEKATPGRYDVVIVGTGIVGLATAYRLVQAGMGLRIAMLDKEAAVGAHQTGHNSGVLHSGAYYKPGSLKARTAVAGRSAMVQFCAEYGIAHDVCGKVIVATHADETARMRDLFDRAEKNGVRAELIDSVRLRELEPHAAGIEAIHVPETGIVDYLDVCRVLARLGAGEGVEYGFGTSVVSIDDRDKLVHIGTTAGEYQARLLINCAGLHSDRVAELDRKINDGTHIVPFRGEYYELIESRRDLVRNLIYPVPDPSFPFLGVHLTRMIDGSIHAGPNAVLALDREGYRWRDVSVRQIFAHATDVGLWRLGRRHWRTGAGEVWRSFNKRAFLKALQRLVPDLKLDDLERSPAGVRAQALRPDGQLVDDFVVVSRTHTVHVLNAPSPAATASLQIGTAVVAQAVPRLNS